LLPDLGTVRFLPISEFRNWLIFYMESEAEILILRVLHGARDIPALFQS
jgi:plasmid stabilization system protein ParE